MKYKKKLLEFLRIIQNAYAPGERLPAAPEMCARLDVSKLTYGKILGEARLHGHIRMRPGCGGVHVSGRKIVKIGLLLGRGIRSDVIADRPLFIETLRALYENDYAEQFVHTDPSESLAEGLTIRNISLLVAFPWHYAPEMEFYRKAARESGIPVVLLGTWFPPENEDHPESVCRIFSNGAFACAEIAEKLREKKITRIMSTVRFAQENRNVFAGNGIELLPPVDPETVRPNPGRLLPRIRREKPQLLLLDGGSEFYCSIMESLLELPEKRRPSLFLYKPEHMAEELRRRAEKIEILGAYTLRSDLLATNAVSLIRRHLTEKIPLADFQVSNCVCE